MTEKTYEMMWDCEYCGTKKLLGKTHRFCAECGAPQNPERRYFPPENEKVAVEDHQFVGADLHCPACQEPQSAAVKHCANCGSPLQGGKAAAVQADQVVGADGRVVQPPAAGGEKKSSKAGCIIGGIVAVVVLIVAVILVNKFWTSEAALEVTKLTWERKIEVVTYKTVKGTSDCSDVPDGAKVTKKKKGKETCKTRKKDQGDGTFKEIKECKKAADQCDYAGTAWAVTDTLEESGDVDDEPQWPKTKGLKKKKKKAKIGDKAEGKRIESYIVHFKEKGGDTHTCSFSDEKKWKKFDKGDTYTGETGMIGGDLKCDKLKKK